MLRFFALTLLLGAPALGDDVTAGTELLMTFLVHRHGDRTITSSSPYSTDTELLDALSAKYGYGQLTDEGKRTAYKLGQFIRSRYDDILSEKYNKSEIYIRSTDSPRTKMTVLTAMSAVYPAGEDNWSDTINWTPVPYTTVPIKYDINMPEFNCPTFISYYYTTLLDNPSSMDSYFDVINEWSAITGINITQYPIQISSVYDVYMSEISLGMSLGAELDALLPELELAAGAAIDYELGNDDYIKYQAGPLLNQFFNQTDTIINGDDTQRVQIYSAHDFNVYSFAAVSQITPRQGAPKYGSAFALELRKVTETGKYVILPVYLKDPKTGEMLYLQVDGCDELLCDYDTFKRITSSYAMEEDDWRSECGFTDDMIIDDDTVN